MIESVKNIYFRSFLSSCNYSCSYCRFAKKKMNEVEILKDEKCVQRFCDFIDSTNFKNRVSIFLTPYGEGLIHDYYIRAMARLAMNPKCQYISCQTNLSFDESVFINTLKSYHVDLSKVKLWASCHPEMISAGEFVKKVNKLKADIDLSVGIVAIPQNLESVFDLRKELPKNIYMWVNGKDGEKTRYTKEQIQSLVSVDPLFYNEISKRKVEDNCCNAGEDSVFIEGNGDAFACHINKNQLFNIFKRTDLVKSFRCDRRYCDCYLSYSLRKDSNLNSYFKQYTPIRLPFKREIQAIFLDIDGTITNENGMISQEAVEQLEFLKDKVKIYLATSLPLPVAMKKCNRVKDCLSGGVFANGGHIIDWGLDYSKVYGIEKNTLDIILYIPQFRIYKLDGEVYKVLTYKNYATQELKSNPNIKLIWENNLISIGSKDASKLKGILKICKLNSYNEDKVFVMGNSLNDLEMIRYFKNSVAAINSQCKLKESARYIFDIGHLAMFIL
ncbi:UNVERIFIED_CONTAM: hydroxymethylpyrimidine pyrophosphatase-like HAD family hydrolase [Acetivibrio alkalicellulosi]